MRSSHLGPCFRKHFILVFVKTHLTIQSGLDVLPRLLEFDHLLVFELL